MKLNVVVAGAFATALLFCAYISWPALNGPFLFDDFPNLENLARLSGHLDWASIQRYMSSFQSDVGRPLSMLSFVINDANWPSDPWSFKYTNLLLHLLVGITVFGLARALACIAASESRANLVALLAMSAWLLHPMQLATSMLVVQRMTQMAALFGFAGLWGYVAIVRQSASVSRAVGAVATLGLGTILATLCKENGALIPLLAVVINITLLRERLALAPSAARNILRWGAVLPVVLLLSAIIWRWDAVANYGGRDFSMAERLLTQGRVVVDYVRRILLPTMRGDSLYHDDFVVSRGLVDPPSTLLALLFLVVLFGMAIWQRKKRPTFSFGILWFLAAHSLESTIFPLEMYFEHRNYIPMFGLLYWSSVWAATIERRAITLRLCLAVIWIAFAAWLTWVQSPIWGNAGSLATVWAQEHPNSPRAAQQRADYLIRNGDASLAAKLLLDAYSAGVRGSDFPFQATLIGCATHKSEIAKDANQWLASAAEKGEQNNALLMTIRKLRGYVENAICPDILDDSEWLSLTTSLLKNPHYKDGAAQSYLHTERAYLFEWRRDLDGTMGEYEAAWTSHPTPRLAMLIAATLTSAGLYDDAEVWITHGLSLKPTGIRKLLTQDKQDLMKMRSLIRNFKVERSRKSQAISPPHQLQNGLVETEDATK